MFNYHNHNTRSLLWTLIPIHRRGDKLVQGQGAEEMTGFEGASESSTFECPSTAEMVTGPHGGRFKLPALFGNSSAHS